MKALVMARGAGRRMRDPDDDASLTAAQQRAADAGRKGMMPVGGDGGRPFLDYVLSTLADAGCAAVCLVVAPDHEDVRAHYARQRPRRVRLSYAVQAEPLGTADAVLAAERFVASDPFLVVNADNLYPVDALRALVSLDGPGLPGFEREALVEDSGFPAARVAQFALLDVDAAGWLQAIDEKPGEAALAARGPHALVSMNAWRFDRRIFGACRDSPPSPRGELELAGAVMLAMKRGVRFRVVPARGAALDLSRRGDVAAVSRRLAGFVPRP